MTPFASVTSVHLAAISHRLFARRKVMEFLATGDDARLDDVHKVSWQERVRNDITQRDGFATR